MLKRDVSFALGNHTRDFLLKNYHTEVQPWIENFNEIIAQLSAKWEMTITDYEVQSRFGCILYGFSKNTSTAMKLVPPCCPRLEQEVLCYRMLPYHNMVELYDYDFDLGGILLHRVNSFPIPNMNVIANLFQAMFEERASASHPEITDYSEAFHESLNRAYTSISRSQDPRQQSFLAVIEKARSYYKKIERNGTFFLHGDAHIHNILYDGSDVFLIDPIGYNGPFEIEYARFIGTFVRENHLYDIPLRDLVEKVSRGNCPVQEIMIAIGCDVTMRACNTFFEGNTDEEIIDALCWSKRIWKMVDSALTLRDF